MEYIRCCIISEKKAYRGIDREVNMRIFNDEKNCIAYETAFNQYLNYLSTEEENTFENLYTISLFSDFINCHYGKSEIIMYAKHPIQDGISCRFFGIDIVDAHLKSIIKAGINVKNGFCNTNQYDLYSKSTEAQMVIQNLKEKTHIYSDLQCIYVYLLENE